MSIRQLRIKNFRAFEDTCILNFSGIGAIVGRNDVGKSAILHGLKLFFSPPSKGGATPWMIHRQDTARVVEIEIAFDPKGLRADKIKVDAKNEVALVAENLIDSLGFLRLRRRISATKVLPLELQIYDYDDADLFGLAALKKEGDLLALLKDRGLAATPSGKETNAEKRAALRKYAEKQGLQKKTDWIEVEEKEKAFLAVLPEFRLFEDVAQYGMDETPVQNQFKGIVDRAIQAVPEAKTIGDTVNTTLQTEFEKVYQHLKHLTPTVAGVKATAGMDWKKAISNIGLSWLDEFAMEVPYGFRGAGIRRLFMVAYFQYEAAEGLLDPKGPKYVYCIEEPEVHLHPGAQRELIDALNGLVELGHTILFTTHSPVFAAAVPIDSLTLVRRDNVAAQAIQAPGLNMSDVASELGVEASDRLIGKNCVVLVEGKKDEHFYSMALTALHGAGHTALNPADVCFLQTGGDSNLEYVVTTRRMDEVGMRWAVIADSDKLNAADPESQAVKRMKANLPASCRLFHEIMRTTLENFLHPRAIRTETGFDVLVPTYGPMTHIATGLSVKKSEKGSIKDKSNAITNLMTAAEFLATSIPVGLASPNDSELVKLFNALKVAFDL